jgi:hypothetical protein
MSRIVRVVFCQLVSGHCPLQKMRNDVHDCTLSQLLPVCQVYNGRQARR